MPPLTALPAQSHTALHRRQQEIEYRLEEIEALFEANGGSERMPAASGLYQRLIAEWDALEAEWERRSKEHDDG